MARSSYLFTMLRRLDRVLEATKPKVLAEFAAKTKQKLNPDPFLLRASGQSFYNTSPMDMGELMGVRTTSARTCLPTCRHFHRLPAIFLSGLISQHRRWLTEFRNNQDDSFMVALFADHWLR